MTTKTIAAGVAAVALAATGVVVGTQVTNNSTTAAQTTTQMGCNDWTEQLSTGECQAAGTIRYVALYNLQGAAQFCKWKAANPGEWSRLNGYAGSEVEPINIITWLGASIKNELEAYFVTGAPTMSWVRPNGTTALGIQPNTSPNICTGKVIVPPVVSGVTPGQTDATVTIDTNG